MTHTSTSFPTASGNMCLILLREVIFYGILIVFTFGVDSTYRYPPRRVPVFASFVSTSVLLYYIAEQMWVGLTRYTRGAGTRSYQRSP